MLSQDTNRRNKKWRWLLLTIVLAIIFAATFVALLPIGIERGLEGWFLAHGVESAEVGDVDFNPFTGKLTASDISLRKSNMNVLNVERVGLELDWLPIFKKRVRIHRISLESSTINISRSADGAWSIGGLTLPFGGPSAEGPWGLGVLKIDLNDVRVIHRAPNLSNQVMIDRAQISSVRSWAPQEPTRFSIRLMSDKGVLALDGTAKPLVIKPSLTANARSDGLSLDWLGPYLKLYGIEGFTAILDGGAKVRANFTADNALEQISIVGDARIRDSGAELKPSGLRLRQRKMSLDGSFSFARGDSFTAAINVVSEGLIVDSTTRNLNVVTLDRLNVKGLKLENTNILTKETRLSNALFFQRTLKSKSGTKKPSHIFEVEHLVFREAGILEMNRIVVGEADLNGANVWLFMDSEGSVELLKSILKKQREEKQIAEVSLGLGKVKIAKGSRVVFQDNNLSPPIKLVLYPFEAGLGPLDTNAPGSKTPVDVKAKIGKYASFNADGFIQPFAEKKAIDFNGKIKSFDLKKLAPYASERYGFILNSGQLDADFELHVAGSALDTKAELLIYKLRAQKAEGDDKFAGLFNIPFEKAISIMRDKDDNIRLRVSASGDFTDMEFKFHNVMQKALREAIQQATVSYFVPIGVTVLTGVTLSPGTFFVAKKLLQLASTLRFEPVVFSPLGEQLSGEGAAYLDRVAELLDNKPNVRLIICGTSTLADLNTFRGEPVTPKDETKSKEVFLSDEEKELMLALAQRRSDAVKDYMVQTGGIDAGKLVICSPVMEKDNKAPPRVELGI